MYKKVEPITVVDIHCYRLKSLSGECRGKVKTKVAFEKDQRQPKRGRASLISAPIISINFFSQLTVAFRSGLWESDLFYILNKKIYNKK